MSEPLVSVIIPNYNYAKYLREAVDGALNQTYPNIEVIVVDDGSTDESRAILQSFGDKIKAIFQKNAGVSAARNNGVVNSGGEFIAFLDADDAWLPNKIEKQVKKFSGSENFGLVHVGVQDTDADGKIIAEHLDGLEGDVSQELLLFKRAVILGGGSGIMTPRKVFDETGGFDLRLSTSADWDFFYRVSSRYRVGFVSEPLLRYRVHGANMHGNVERMEREMVAAFNKAFEGKVMSGVKRIAYGNLYRVLAGSYFRSGKYLAFSRNAALSIWLSPGNFSYFVKFPLRFFQRKTF